VKYKGKKQLSTCKLVFSRLSTWFLVFYLVEKHTQNV